MRPKNCVKLGPTKKAGSCLHVWTAAMAEERVERRLTAILAADVAGYSRLMGADEEGTLAALKTLRREVADPKIKEHRGRIVNTTAMVCSASLRAWSTRFVVRSRCSARWPRATPVCNLSGASIS